MKKITLMLVMIFSLAVKVYAIPLPTPGASIDYDGSSEWIGWGDAFYSDTVSVGVWLYADTLDSNAKMLIHKRNVAGGVTSGSLEWQTNIAGTSDLGRWIGWDSNPDIIFNSTSTTTFPTVTWIYFSATCPGNGAGNALQWFDGASEGAAAQTGAIQNVTTGIQFASRSNDDNNRYYNGKAAYIQVWSKELDEAEVLNTMWFPGSVPDAQEIYATLLGGSTTDISINNNTAIGTEGDLWTDGPPISLGMGWEN